MPQKLAQSHKTARPKVGITDISTYEKMHSEKFPGDSKS